MASDDGRELARRRAELHVGAARLFLEHFQAQTFDVEDSSKKKFAWTFAAVAHAMNHVKAALILQEIGLSYVAKANVRVAFEHALIAQSVVHTDDGEEQLIDSAFKITHNVIRDLGRGRTDLPHDLRARIDEKKARTDEKPKTRELKIPAIADRFDGGTGAIYSLYRELTCAVHVSAYTVEAYVSVRGQQLDLLRCSEYEPDADHLLALGWSAVLAVSAIESFRVGDPFRQWINTAAKDHGLVPDLVPGGAYRHLDLRPPQPSA
jgi:hypothetical protein